MFDTLYRRRAPRPPGSFIVSLGVHAAALMALTAGAGVVTTATRQIAEGLTYLAPLPSARAGPDAGAERLTFADLAGLAGTADALGAGGFADLPLPGTGIPTGGLTPGTEDAPVLQQVATDFTRTADSVYLSSQVDNPVAYDANSAAPIYPDSLRLAGVEGVVEAQFVVDTTGRVELSSFVLLESTHRRFTESVRAALPGMLFQPAQLNGRKIKQLVQLPFVFRIQPAGGGTAAETDTGRAAADTATDAATEADAAAATDTGGATDSGTAADSSGRRGATTP